MYYLFINIHNFFIFSETFSQDYDIHIEENCFLCHAKTPSRGTDSAPEFLKGDIILQVTAHETILAHRGGVWITDIGGFN
ncbi:MAG TPA: hypothetical protein PK360_02420 [bacterium]|nr:hypothetical protein [bacterium]